jgi:hypothetical protein
MPAPIRTLFAALVALLFALPGIGGDGGEGPGLGFWILPRAGAVTSGVTCNLQAPRDAITWVGLERSIQIRLSSEVGQAVAVVTDSVSGFTIPLTVVGRDVPLPGQVVQSLAAAGVSCAQIVVMDAARTGYVLQLRIDGNSVSLQVY